MGVADGVSTLGFNSANEHIFRIIPFPVFLQILSSTNAGYQRSVIDELSILGIYAEDPTLPEEEESYGVDKTKIPSATDIAITQIIWTASPSILPL